jgi:hypothetical protein
MGKWLYSHEIYQLIILIKYLNYLPIRSFAYLPIACCIFKPESAIQA